MCFTEYVSVAILAQIESTVAQALVSVCVMDVKSVPHEAISEICAYIGDLRSFACVARALVTDTHWHGRVEQLWPGAAAMLFGTFAFQARASLQEHLQLKSRYAGLIQVAPQRVSDFTGGMAPTRLNNLN